MPCERFHDALTDAAAGQPLAAPLEGHLAACDGCRAELVRLRELMAAADDALSLLASAEPSASLRARVLAAAAERSATPSWRWGFTWTAAAAAVLALASLGAWRVAVGRAPAAPAAAAAAENARPSPPPAPPSADTASPRSAAAAPSRAAGAPATAPATRETTLAEGSRRPLPPTVRARVEEPEVIVPVGEQEALLRLVALVHRQGLSGTALTGAGVPSADLTEPTPIEIRPLEIVPLDPAQESGT